MRKSRWRYTRNCSVNDLDYIVIGQAVEDINPTVASCEKAKQIDFLVLTDIDSITSGLIQMTGSLWSPL